MASDFFQQQDVARRNTTRLVILFALAVLAIIVSIDLLVTVVMGYAEGRFTLARALDPEVVLLAAGGTLAVVAGGSLYKIAQLRGGGRVVAESLGGRLLTADTADPMEQRLLNVVEEMAIASGTSVPPVYLLDHESGINAFAAGFTPDDAVVGVTKGTATRLTRDELQGVIAHEFSHILNGDMRLNIRLMGLLHGILIIGIIGYFILRSTFYARMGRRRGREGNAALVMAALGVGLAAVGFAGTFFGNMIKAAVSRQREYLADASAVQFTRDPVGIAGALKKIGGAAGGSKIDHPNAPEASHLFFGRATSGLSALFSTHPPLTERIRRIDPAWDGAFPEAVEPVVAPAPAPATPAASGFAGGEEFRRADAATADPVGSIGRPDAAHLSYAAQLIASLPRPLAEAARSPYGARAAMYALLLDRQQHAIRERQVSHLQTAADPGVYQETLKVAPLVDRLDAAQRLPLVEIALPALRALTEAQARLFIGNVRRLVEADETIAPFEWALHRILVRDVSAQHRQAEAPGTRHRFVESVRSQCELLLSVLAHTGHRDAEAATTAFDRGRERLSLPDLRLLPPEQSRLSATLDAALVELDASAPDVKRQVLQAATACVMADRRASAEETELLRAISASMSCPMPPLIEGRN